MHDFAISAQEFWWLYCYRDNLPALAKWLGAASSCQMAWRRHHVG